ncbi:formate/nitrite transporter family protein [Clostridium hydrogeniformans]|uniref:formate/nitrite transporter family protein n=1 Tax=Clostridium hydrogeniformans TaxID=349933 RepID=UPI0004834624|nr:formate/nitrite transporter family protein [Clostridium hydrogeniformans]
MDKFMLKPNEIIDDVLLAYETKANYPRLKSIILGFLSGAFIALGAYASTVVSHGISNPSLSKLMAALIFPIGLTLIVLCGTDLFTGNTLLTIPLLERKISFKQLCINWFLIYFTNFLGAIFISSMIYFSGSLDFNNFALGGYALKMASTKSSVEFIPAMLSGVLCNTLVCLAVWCSYAAKDIISKLTTVWLIIMTFVISGFEHSVANMYYLTIGLLAKNNPNYVNSINLSSEKLSYIDISHMFKNLIPVTLGNIIGGAIFVSLTFWILYKYIPRNKKIKRDFAA